ncbi:hypothetical protein BU16DRAFT_127441 [Lophium mytilinum]|uniref:Uncharacterized protein n=1 Tax=Lophium mytilinum TaxID=390894 RepID=A0A6A6QIB3_9PEZI|nr:hypothetical protein BU16DRAFT_127441 [Lophium mytilinum]
MSFSKETTEAHLLVPLLLFQSCFALLLRLVSMRTCYRNRRKLEQTRFMVLQSGVYNIPGAEHHSHERVVYAYSLVQSTPFTCCRAIPAKPALTTQKQHKNTKKKKDQKSKNTTSPDGRCRKPVLQVFSVAGSHAHARRLAYCKYRTC